VSSPEPSASAGARRRATAWVGPSAQAEGLPRYIEVLRQGIWLIVASLVLCIGGAVLYLSQAEKVYEAAADLIVTPLPRDLPVPVPGLIQQSPDPTRDVETVARLVASPSVARRVKRELDLEGTTKRILRDVAVAPVAQSNIVNITAKGSTPEKAQALASGFAEAMVAERTARMKETLEPIITALEAQVRDTPQVAGDNANPNSPASQLFFFETLNAGKDPTVRVESLAELPTEQSAPRPMLTLAAATVAGLVLGLLGAFGLVLLDPRLRREEQLRQRFRLPILARVPVERNRRRRPLLPTELSMGALDSYQTLRAALTTSRKDALIGRLVLVTGPSPGDGKTTTAINLASTLAAAGKRVIIIEADSRRPSMGRALGIVPEHGLASVITGRTYLVDALIPVGGEDSKLRALLTAPDEAPAADVLSDIAVETLLLQAQKLADWVIVDSPPLNHVAETMTLAKMVDDVLVVVRLGRSNMRDMNELAEMLVQQDIEPRGFVLLSGQARPGYY
jgi:non-specific protein-tyrosine kinase